MKKSSKYILLTAFSYILVEEPKFCNQLLDILVNTAKEHADEHKKTKDA